MTASEEVDQMAMVFDERLSKQLEANYRKRDFQRRRRLVEEALGLGKGETVLDVGCGPGFYLEELAPAVEPGGQLAGIDSSEQMVELARRRCAGIPNVELQMASATSLPFADAKFDAAISVQVLEFVAELDAALTELHRVLRPGGRVVVWDVDWTAAAWHSDQPDRSARVLRAWDGHLSHPALPRTLAARLRAAGFTGVAVEGHAFATADFSEEAYGVALIPAITRHAAEAGGLGEEAQEWADELRRLGEAGRFFASVPQYCFTAVRP
jgi:ubiquinone/menaquinone biosynthesis C-methylase UbiE